MLENNYKQTELHIAEITAWLAVNYAGIVTDTNAFEKEIGYAIDAASYDVQYGGNSATPDTTKVLSLIPMVLLYICIAKTAVAAAYGRLATIASRKLYKKQQLQNQQEIPETQDTRTAVIT